MADYLSIFMLQLIKNSTWISKIIQYSHRELVSILLLLLISLA